MTLYSIEHPDSLNSIHLVQNLETLQVFDFVAVIFFKNAKKWWSEHEFRNELLIFTTYENCLDKIRPPLAIFLHFSKKNMMTKSSVNFLSPEPNGLGYYFKIY